MKLCYFTTDPGRKPRRGGGLFDIVKPWNAGGRDACENEANHAGAGRLAEQTQRTLSAEQTHRT